ncbi:hypothetical protein DSCO28_49970 [Desulfosarcina ovata subsp. sediminis]|uniref:Porin domain-containing protein n=1 Tax=Desulfosarcina ovata subsp. sediminis TaxID=885957 RepID=A0A5K7ZWE3_9BACT|nr:hypothetical protein [Desulfosarcina ovata]BBO84431.1 hypothetical protein DSCO28_49970 [Desulfosarcina ovata subsp. sediminis]
MKKFAAIFFVAVLSLALTAPAFALENEFGGYFRVRMFNHTNFDGDDDSRQNEAQAVDTRTRLYYTAHINDNLKFVNKFEMDADWGDDGYGDFGADGIKVEVKNSYIDFNFGPANVKMGAQGGVIQRGFVVDDDFSGITVGIAGLTARYAKIEENGDSSADDAQLFQVAYALDLGGLTLTPNFTYYDLYDDQVEIEGYEIQLEDPKVWFLGLDVDGAAGALSYWGTFIYEGGELNSDVDVDAFLLAVGAGMDLSDAMELHFETFYASGQDDDADDLEAFTVPVGQSYYWSEIMGLGMFGDLLDEGASNNSCADAVSDIWAANVGVSYKVNEKLSLGADLWYAQLAEDNDSGDKDLGTEIDLSASYTIVDGLQLDVVAAYLFAGDVTNEGADDDADPIEIGAQFSVAF